MKRYIVHFIYREKYIKSFLVTALNMKEARLYIQDVKEEFCKEIGLQKNRVRVVLNRG